MRSSAKQITDVALRLRALFRRLGTGLDGPGSFDDADVWYCILEGTAETTVAEAQAKARPTKSDPDKSASIRHWLAQGSPRSTILALPSLMKFAYRV